jgi:hypothetical protein
MTMELHDPVTGDEPIYDRNGIRRSKDGRPYVTDPCPASLLAGDQPTDTVCVDGRVPGKRPGTTKQCPKCKGKGNKETLLTRCTTFVGALEERNGLENWMKRTVLVGAWSDEGLRRRIGYVDPDDRETLDALADEAFTLGEGYEKAQKGTDLHALMERVDRGEELGDVSFEDRQDAAAWRNLLDRYGIEVLDVEKFV